MKICLVIFAVLSLSQGKTSELCVAFNYFIGQKFNKYVQMHIAR
jgi:hypothetical protein